MKQNLPDIFISFPGFNKAEAGFNQKQLPENIEHWARF